MEQDFQETISFFFLLCGCFSLAYLTVSHLGIVKIFSTFTSYIKMTKVSVLFKRMTSQAVQDVVLIAHFSFELV